MSLVVLVTTSPYCFNIRREAVLYCPTSSANTLWFWGKPGKTCAIINPLVGSCPIRCSINSSFIWEFEPVRFRCVPCPFEPCGCSSFVQGGASPSSCLVKWLRVQGLAIKLHGLLMYFYYNEHLI